MQGLFQLSHSHVTNIPMFLVIYKMSNRPANLATPETLRLGCLVGVAPIKLQATSMQEDQDSKSETVLTVKHVSLHNLCMHGLLS